MANVVAIGIDIVHIARCQRLYQRYGSRFTRRFLTAPELAALNQRRGPAVNQFLAGRWAAKEAAYKALSTVVSGRVSLREVEVSELPGGAPAIRFLAQTAALAEHAGVRRSLVSISHETDVAVAQVLLLK